MYNSQESLRPSTYLVDANKKYHKAWKQIDEYIQLHGENWPSWCFIPSNANFRKFNVDEISKYQNESCQYAIALSGLAAWRATQSVYRFDRDVVDALWNTSLEGDISTEVLYFLPEWCVYVETNRRKLDLGRSLYGFFSFLDYQLDEDSDEAKTEWIVIYLDLEDDKTGKRMLSPYMFPTKKRCGASLTIDEIITIFMDNESDEYFEVDPNLWDNHRLKQYVERDLRSILPGIFSLLLYLCSANAEFKCSSGNSEAPNIPEPKKTKAGKRFFPPKQPLVWETAWRVGASIRAYNLSAASPNELESCDTGGVKRPHMRRAHWHSFWTGSHKNVRVLRSKWLPPIPVNVSSDDDLIATVKGVD